MSIRTLLIASVSSAVAAIVTSYFWRRGTPIAAAATPVIVALVSELLHRPTERIAQRLTTEVDALPEAAGAGPPPRQEERRPRPAREEPLAGPRERTRPLAPRGRGDAPPRRARPVDHPTPEFRVYRSRPTSRPSGLPWKPILATAAIAFAIAAAVLTLPELIAGRSLGNDDRGTTFFGGAGTDEEKPSPAEPETVPAEAEPEQRERTEPQRTTPAPEPEQTTPTAPQTTPSPAPPERTTPSAPPEP